MVLPHGSLPEMKLVKKKNTTTCRWGASMQCATGENSCFMVAWELIGHLILLPAEGLR